MSTPRQHARSAHACNQGRVLEQMDSWACSAGRRGERSGPD